MNTITEAITRLLRGPRVSRLLEVVGIDPKRYWLLMDLFDQLSERGEMLDQLGRNGVALKPAAWLYFAMSSLFSLLFVATRTDLATYSSMFLVFTGNPLVFPNIGNAAEFVGQTPISVNLIKGISRPLPVRFCQPLRNLIPVPEGFGQTVRR